MAEETLLPERIRHVAPEDYDETLHAEGRCQSGKVYNVIRRAVGAELGKLDGAEALVCDCANGKEYVIPVEECFDEHGRKMIDLSVN